MNKGKNIIFGYNHLPDRLRKANIYVFILTFRIFRPILILQYGKDSSDLIKIYSYFLPLCSVNHASLYTGLLLCIRFYAEE